MAKRPPKGMIVYALSTLSQSPLAIPASTCVDGVCSIHFVLSFLDFGSCYLNPAAANTCRSSRCRLLSSLIRSGCLSSHLRDNMTGEATLVQSLTSDGRSITRLRTVEQFWHEDRARVTLRSLFAGGRAPLLIVHARSNDTYASSFLHNHHGPASPLPFALVEASSPG